MACLRGFFFIFPQEQDIFSPYSFLLKFGNPKRMDISQCLISSTAALFPLWLYGPWEMSASGVDSAYRSLFSRPLNLFLPSPPLYPYLFSIEFSSTAPILRICPSLQNVNFAAMARFAHACLFSPSHFLSFVLLGIAHLSDLEIPPHIQCNSRDLSMGPR